MDERTLVERFHQGYCTNAFAFFGAHPAYENGTGVRFCVYAPHARRVFLCGPFTDWDDHPLLMERTCYQGIWTIFVEGLVSFTSYKYRIEDENGRFFDKSDPYAFYSELRPANASRVYDLSKISWYDEAWMKTRTLNYDRPMSIYEIYAGGWRKNRSDLYSYHALKDNLIPYMKEHGFTHVECMPLTEFPFDGSWGYEASGYYAVTSRYGTPRDFASFVDACHQQEIGVIIDFVPAHFVKDSFGLAEFDGTPLYEYPDRKDAESEWGTLNFNLWSEEVRSFLISAVCFWCETYHVDGIRIDAVKNMIYWGGDSSRGFNSGGLDFIRRLNAMVHEKYPSVMMFAEDSSDYEGVSGNEDAGGLGFNYKWDLGWMHDTLSYYGEDPLYRCYTHDKITFSMVYFHQERFVLPLGHDENVHGKKTVIDKMFGDYEMKFSQVRNMYAYMFAHPGKKLNFMGNEIASFREFDENRELDWNLLEYPIHDAFLRFFTDLNRTYSAHPALYAKDYDPDGFFWINPDNCRQSVYSFCRTDGNEVMVCIFNCTSAYYENYDIDVPQSGTYEELINSEKDIYNGCGAVNEEPSAAWHNRQNGYSITVRIAPFAAMWLIRR